MMNSPMSGHNCRHSHTRHGHKNTSVTRRVSRRLAGSAAILGFLAGPAFAQAVSPVAQAVAPPVASVGTVPVAASYRLAPDDQLEIFVQGHDELHQTVTLLSDGTFSYPIVGKVAAAGKSVDQLTALLTRGIGGICKDPQVTVAVRLSHVPKISVAGSVKTPGLVDYHPGLRLMEVLATSGGLNDTPETTQATIATDGGAKTIPVDLVRLMKDGDATQNLPLSPGDIVLLSPRDPATSMIQVIGEVVKPGQFPVLTGGSTVLSVMTEAGGATPLAALTQVQVLHAGQVQTLNLSPLKYNLNDPAGKVTLVAGDTLLVPVNKAKVAVVGEVRTPGIYAMPDGEPLTITDGLSLAGGPNDDGDKKQVAILRRGPDGKRRVTTLSLDHLTAGDASAADTALLPGDIVVVPTRRKGHSGAEALGVLSPLSLFGNLLRGF